GLGKVSRPDLRPSANCDLPHRLARGKHLPNSPFWNADLEPGSHWRDDARIIDPPIRIGGAILRSHRHICGFFNNHDEQYQLLRMRTPSNDCLADGTVFPNWTI